MWLDSSGAHSSCALTICFHCDPYVWWSYYEPSGNQWAETHLGAHPLVISLISLLALAIWALSLGQWLSVQHDWSGSSSRLLINDCGWGNGSFLFFSFSTLFLCFSLPASSTGAWCMWCFHEVYWMTDTSRRGGGLTGWLGDCHPHGCLRWRHTHKHTHIYLHHTLSLAFCCGLNSLATRIIFTSSALYSTLLSSAVSPQWSSWNKHTQSSTKTSWRRFSPVLILIIIH